MTAFETIRAEDWLNVEFFDFLPTNFEYEHVNNLLHRMRSKQLLSLDACLDYKTYLPAPKSVSSRVQVHPVWLF